MSNSVNDRKTERPKRIPVGSRKILVADERPGYHRRWVNDDGERILQFKDAGYAHVTNSDADISDARTQDPSKIGSSVVRKSVGDNKWAYLMEIPLEFYNEDQEAKQKYVDEKEETYDPTKRISSTMYGAQLKKTKGEA